MPKVRGLTRQQREEAEMKRVSGNLLRVLGAQRELAPSPCLV